jgi:UrcA family protein
MYTPTHDATRARAVRLVTAVAASLVALSAFAGGTGPRHDELPTAAVYYGDLDLATPAGNRALYERMSLAAKRVCPAADNRDLARVAAVRACREAALDGAVRAAGNPLLAALHEERTRHG